MSQLFEQVLEVQQADLDVLGHVNNVVYVQWMQNIALAHSTVLGLDLDAFIALKHAMVAGEHQMKYRKACVLGDQLILRTWLGELNALSSVRHYAFYRLSDGEVVFQAQTRWVCVEIATGRAKRLSPTFTQAYQPLDANINPMAFDQQ